MKKSKIIATIAATAVLSLGGAFALSACGHTHTYEEEWTKTETHHYYAPTCEHKDDKDAWKDYGEHVYDNDADTDCNTCGHVRTVISLTGTITAPGPDGGYKLAGATVTVGGKTATSDENGVYTVYGLTVGTGAEVTISHPACNDFTGTVDITAGSNTLDKQLSVKPIAELGQSYFQLMDMETSDKTDFPDNGNVIWPSHGNVRHENEGTRLDVSNQTGDMAAVIYQKFKITSANSKMMFRMRGYGNVGQVAVRVIDINGYTKTDLKPVGSDDVWQTMDSASYFIPCEYDLSAYEGKDVVIIIGAKSGYDNVIDRVRFIGANESFLLHYVTAADLSKLEASTAQDLEGADAVKNEIKNWNKVGDQGEADQGWLFKDGPSAADGSTDLCVFAYKKLTFSGTKSISVSARTFVGQTIPNKPDVPAQIVVKVFKADGTEVEVNGNCYTIDTDSYQTAYMSFGETLNGDYTFVIGIARGHRLAVNEIKFLGQELVQGTVSGTVKAGTEGIEAPLLSTLTLSEISLPLSA